MDPQTAPKKLYLAGFDIFRPDAREHGAYLKGLCERHGFEGLYPLDTESPPGMTKSERASWVYRADLALLNDADGVLANVNPFRGLEPDSGTAFEIGYAVAKGKPVWVYTDAAPVKDRLGGAVVDSDGFQIEDHDLPVNAMIGVPCRLVRGGPVECLAAAARECRGSAVGSVVGSFHRGRCP
jgi:nucleoside 2-deoxyribosyltransferase